MYYELCHGGVDSVRELAIDRRGDIKMNYIIDDVSIGEWFISYLISLIPCVGIVMMFIWAFSDQTKPSKRNFYRAYLIVCAIVTVFSIGITILTYIMSAIS